MFQSIFRYEILQRPSIQPYQHQQWQQEMQPLSLKNSKVHFSYINLFLKPRCLVFKIVDSNTKMFDRKFLFVSNGENTLKAAINDEKSHPIKIKKVSGKYLLY